MSNKEMTQKEKTEMLEKVLKKHGYNSDAITEIVRMTFTDKPANRPSPAPEEK